MRLHRRKGYDMEKFAECIVKLAVWVSFILGILLLGIAALLIFASKIVLPVLYCALIVGCIAGVCYSLFCLLSAVFVFCKIKKAGSYECEAC